MNITVKDEKNSIVSQIDALPISTRQRSRAKAALAKANAVIGAFFAVSDFLGHRQTETVMRPSLNPQK